jgi:SAM-dependent methyltransferase
VLVRHVSQVVSAYDSKAADYERHLEADRWMRRALWRHFAEIFRAGDHVLDIGCGTGIDTIHLASHGVRVTAVDISPGMVERLRAKLAQTSLESQVDVRIGDATEVIRQLTGRFDGLVSSFAALNTVDLRSLASEAARLLRPEGRLVAHLLSPGHRARGSLRRWWRMVRSSASHREIEVDAHGHVTLPEDELYRRFFATDFIHRRAYALGLLVGDDVGLRVPERVLDLAARFETRVSGTPALTSAGRFYVMDLERRRDGR